jgi:hypothetical protein
MDYAEIFARTLQALKDEGRYRVFAYIRRDRGCFPAARHYSGGATRPITVWCSNATPPARRVSVESRSGVNGRRRLTPDIALGPPRSQRRQFHAPRRSIAVLGGRRLDRLPALRERPFDAGRNCPKPHGRLALGPAFGIQTIVPFGCTGATLFRERDRADAAPALYCSTGFPQVVN